MGTVGHRYSGGSSGSANNKRGRLRLRGRRHHHQRPPNAESIRREPKQLRPEGSLVGY